MAIKSFYLKTDGGKKLSDHFAVKEFASVSGGKTYSNTVLVDTSLVEVLEKLHKFLGCSKIIVTSGYRTPAHDKAVGGSGCGYHTKGQAADINCYRKANGKEERIHASEICCALQSLGWKKGIGWIAGAAVHVDSRSWMYYFDEQQGNRSIGKDWYAFFKTKGYNVRRPGDVDGDGDITSTDARLVLQAAAGKAVLSDKEKAAADVDGDGEVTTTDARMILQESVGKE